MNRITSSMFVKILNGDIFISTRFDRIVDVEFRKIIPMSENEKHDSPVIIEPANLYSILNINHDSDEDEIKIAYKRLVLLFHPVYTTISFRRTSLRLPKRKNRRRASSSRFRELMIFYRILERVISMIYLANWG
jgi:hypothetical protein